MKTEETDTISELSFKDYKYLEICVALAEDALNAGDEPFGSILVNAKNEIIATARNKVNAENVLSHPEIELAYWALENLSTEERKSTTMYTTGEHCPMCAAAHGWAEIGPLVYLSSAEQLGEWLQEFGANEAPIHFVASREIIKHIDIKGPGSGVVLEAIKALHKRYNSE
ncbi:nucleoside deaminase [Bizionia saleffrena]|uniref:Nucleoside deaminase n=1 Tax=Bizionia saleffrena TaxID=291189 RepID=A0A8H2QFS9_9FLAO|nr:nucleoside deaminase [Bizionia saleffrena]TYB76689.1 nucleoside deaminase [Bizionia saleffrena]